MYKTLLVTGTILGLIGGQAFAAAEYYVQHKSGVAKCAVSTKKPDGKMEVQVGGAYKTKAAASAAMKMAADCKY